MLRRPAKMTQLLQNGGPFTGDNAATTRITVQPDWWLNTSNGPVGNFPSYKLPIRWWQDQANNQTEIEVPNLKTVTIDRQLSQDAAMIEVDFYNTNTPANGTAGDNPDMFGQPGYTAWNFGASPLAHQKWGQTPNAWKNLLRENSLVRVYAGYGGWTDPVTGDPLTIAEAVAAGNLMLTGVFLIDSVAIQSGSSGGGIGKMIGRDMAKLLIDQPLYPPLVSASFYNYGARQGFGVGAGITYYRNRLVDFPPVPGYGAPGETSPIVDQKSPLEGFWLYVNDMAPYIQGDGYWLVGSDGGVFTYGYANFEGSEGDTRLNAPAVSIDSTVGQGYWCAAQDGGVFNFGDAPFLGSAFGELTGEVIVAIRRTQSCRGYWLCSNKGNVFSFGDAVFHGSLGGTDTIVGFTPRPQGDGYWMVAASGAVYSFGAAQYHGGAAPLSDQAAGIDADALGTGYRIATTTGIVKVFGTAQAYTPTAGTPLYDIALFAPVSGIRRTPDDRGYWLVGQDGGVFTFGDAPFWGSMPPPAPGASDFIADFSGTYNDYSDIVSDISLWAGFWLETANTPSNQRPTVFGLIEETGAYDAIGPIDSSLFDKVQCIDAIKSIRDIMGWQFRIREDGSVQFSAPNIWTMGNFYSDNTPTSYIPVFDEKMNTDYIQTNSDTSLRSSIMVSALDPYLYGGTPANTTVTILIPPNIQSLHGMVKPAMIGVPLYVPITYADQDLMAELQAIQCWLGVRSGQLSAMVDPAICLDDQIQIFDRASGETGIHYVTGIHTEHDLDSGAWLATYSTQFLGEPTNWAITTGAPGTLSDQSFDTNGHINYQDTFPISQNLLNFLANQKSTRTQAFKIGFVDGTGNATAVVPGVE